MISVILNIAVVLVANLSPSLSFESRLQLPHTLGARIVVPQFHITHKTNFSALIFTIFSFFPL